MNSEKSTKATEEQVAYANILSYGSMVGLATLILTFALYVGKVLDPVVPIEKLPELWGMKAKDYLHTAHLPHGWGWVSLVNHGDFVNFVGIAILSGLSVVCYLAILPILIRKKDKAYAIMAVVEVLILVLAASGILKAGGH
jgi:uncharacterized membrane protein